VAIASGRGPLLPSSPYKTRPKGFELPFSCSHIPSFPSSPHAPPLGKPAARETRRRAIAGHPALPVAGEQPLSILASSLASHSAAQEPDAQEHAAEAATSSLAGTRDPDRSSSPHDVYTASPPSSRSW
jgi:hypothetical protein